MTDRWGRAARVYSHAGWWWMVSEGRHHGLVAVVLVDSDRLGAVQHAVGFVQLLFVTIHVFHSLVLPSTLFQEVG